MRKSLKRLDYRENILFFGKSVGVVLVLAYFFYRSIWACIPLSVVGFLYFRMLQRKAEEKRCEQLVLQFKECILSVAASLKAGYAIENAFMESRGDMELLYGTHSVIYQELEQIRRGLVINITLEEQLFGLAERSGGEEIRQFATVFSIAKRGGGNLPEIIRSSSELISQRLEARVEMRTRLSGRQMEQNVMKIIPFAVLVYIGVTYPGYFDVLYHNWQGVAIMTGCFIIYLAAYVMGEKILQEIANELM